MEETTQVSPAASHEAQGQCLFARNTAGEQFLTLRQRACRLPRRLRRLTLQKYKATQVTDVAEQRFAKRSSLARQKTGSARHQKQTSLGNLCRGSNTNVDSGSNAKSDQGKPWHTPSSAASICLTITLAAARCSSPPSARSTLSDRAAAATLEGDKSTSPTQGQLVPRPSERP